MTTLSVIVPATDRPDTLDRCLTAIAAARPDEVIVVDSPAQAGPAAARNLGVRRACGEIFVFVDADVLVHPDAFDRIRTHFAHDPTLVAVFGSYDDRIATSGLVAGYRNLQHRVVHQRAAGRVKSFWAGLGAVRASSFHEVGGFDHERFRTPCVEDIELGERLSQLGPLVLDPALLGTHLKEWTLRSMVTTDFAARGVPWMRLVIEQRHVPRTLNLGLRERASVVAAVATCIGAVSRHPRLAVAGLAAQVALNRDLYSALHRGLGARGVVAGVGLHTLHELTAVCAVPAAIVVELGAQAMRSTARIASTSSPSSR